MMMSGLCDQLCYKCGIQFAVPSSWREARIETKKAIVCPNGHRLFFEWHDKKSRSQIVAENGQLQQELDKAQTKLTSALAEVDRMTARLDQREAERRDADTDTDTPASDPTHSTPRRGKNRKAVSA